MPYHYGNPHLDTDWDVIRNDPAIADLLAGNPGPLSGIGDWFDAKTTGSSATHDAVNAAGLPGGAADLLIHQALGGIGRFGNRVVDLYTGQANSDRNKYDNIRDAQTDAFNKAYEPKYGGRHSSSPFEAMFEDVVNNPGNWELRPDPETQDSAQKKGLRGRRLYPKPERNLGPTPSTKKDYGSKQKPKKKKSEWQKSQERRSKKQAEEEEERQRQRQQMMQGLQSSYSRPNTIPAPLWEAYVPDDGMSNFSIFDDKGRYEGLDVEGLIDAIGVRTKVDPSTGIKY